MTSSKFLIELLEVGRKEFDDNAYPLPKHQADRFRSCCELLVEDDDSLGERSKQRRSCRTKVKTLLGDIFLSVEPEVFLLCTISATVSTLGRVVMLHLVPDLRKWWNAVSHPTGLTEITNRLCQANSISKLLWADRIDSTRSTNSRKRKRTSVLDQVSRQTLPGNDTTCNPDSSQSVISGTTEGELGGGTEISEAMAHPEKDANCATIHSTILPLTTQGVEVILAKLKDGKEAGMTMTFPHRSGWLPFITIPYETCVEIMQQYTVDEAR